MKNYTVLTNQNRRRVLPIALSGALAVVFSVALAQPAHAEHVTPPYVPADIQVAPGNRAFLEGHATGTQDYICLPSGAGFAWVFFGPQATLFNDDLKQIITHFLSPNPFESNTPRVTWQHSRDTSTVWAVATGTSTDPHFVRPGAIAWVRLQVVGSQDGPTHGDTLTATSFIQRVNTIGGSAPSTGCAAVADVGTKALVPYKADYFFYKYVDRDSRDDN